MSVTLTVSGGATLDGFVDSNPYGGAASGDSLFGSTANFSTTGPAFGLGAGESVNSSSASLVGNQWTGTPVSATLVPLPGAVWLLAVPLLWLRQTRSL